MHSGLQQGPQGSHVQADGTPDEQALGKSNHKHSDHQEANQEADQEADNSAVQGRTIQIRQRM